MKKLVFCDMCQDSHLNQYRTAIKIPNIENIIGKDKLTNITGIRFVYQTGEDVVENESIRKDSSQEILCDIPEFEDIEIESFTSEFYFIGDIVKFDQIQNLFKDCVDLKKYQGKMYAVSYKNGEIFDIRPLLAEKGSVYSVQNFEELANVFFEKTGIEFPKIKSR